MTGIEQARLVAIGPPPGVPGRGLESTAKVLVLSGPIARSDIPALCERAGILLERCDADLVICDVAALVDPDAAAVDALARLQLIARRLGRRVWFRHACGELQELLALMGLTEVLPCGPESGLEPGGKAEEREQVGRVEEEGDPGDPLP
jgi:ABC-type transporter Mla MlaB component